MAEPRFTFNIHMENDVKSEAYRVPSSSDDFVSVRIGSQASILVFNSNQANDLLNVIEEAYYLLRGIEDEKSRAARAAARAERENVQAPDWSEEYIGDCDCDSCTDYRNLTWDDEDVAF